MDINDETILATLREVVAERPDFVYEPPGEYESCSYVHGDEPGCLIGHVLNRLGVSLETLSYFEGNAAEHVVRRTVHPGLSDRAASVLRGAQVAQDGGRPWGEALAQAVAA